MNRRHFLTSTIAASAARPAVAVSSPLAANDAEAAGGPRVAVLLVDTDRATTPIDRRIYGHLLEHINHSVVDGLFAAQIRGCGFEGEDFKTYWEPFSDHGSVDCVDIVFQNGKKSVRLHVEGGRAGIRQGRLFVDAGHEYDGSLWVNREAGSPQLTLRVVSSRGDTIASVPLALAGSGWQEGLNIIGEDYLVKAFQYAHEADPNCELYYNDYSVENEAKRKGAVDLIRKLQAAGVKVAAMGLQGHDSLDWPTLQQQEDTINAFAALGVKVAITELDVDVLPRAGRGNSADVSATSAGGANPYVNGLPDDIQKALAKRYADLFGIFVKHANVVSRITFWGVTDGDSWKNDFPVRGRTNYPLLFDREGKPKAAFHSVIETARKK